MTLARALREALEGAPSVILKSGDPKRCNPVTVHGACDKNHGTTKTWACAQRRCSQDCCKSHVDKERAESTIYLSTEAFRMPWCVLVLPYVPRLREVLARVDMLKASRREAWKTVERVILESEGLDPAKWWLGAKAADHPEGDAEREGEVYKPHHNFMWPAVAFGKGKGREGERRKLLFHLRPETLKLLRQAWAALQNRLLIAYGLNRIRHGQANLFYEFRCETGKKLHMARYFCRSFPFWPAKAQRITGLSAFGCQVIKKLNETSAPPVAEVDPALCRICKGPVVYETATVPQHYRTVSRGPAP